MEESERTLEMFWNNHYVRLNNCLYLRKFEQKFKDVCLSLLSIYEQLDRIASEANSENYSNKQLNLKQQEMDYDKCIHMLLSLNEKSKVRFVTITIPTTSLPTNNIPTNTIPTTTTTTTATTATATTSATITNNTFTDTTTSSSVFF